VRVAAAEAAPDQGQVQIKSCILPPFMNRQQHYILVAGTTTFQLDISFDGHCLSCGCGQDHIMSPLKKSRCTHLQGQS